MILMAGPCVIESEANLFSIAKSLENYQADERFDFYFKASFDKANRTSLDSYRGPGLEEVCACCRRSKTISATSF